MNSTHRILFSVLDLATVLHGQSPTDAFQNSVAMAQAAELYGYTRYWFAEHHNMPGVASSAPPIVIGHIAGATRTIRVGSGGVMLPNHAPLIVAEQFGTLAALYPGRIDLGLGRAPGTDQLTAMAIRGRNFQAEHNFVADIRQLQTYFSPENSAAKVRAIPGEGLDIPIWILGSSTDSAIVAATLGLPYAFATHFAPAQFLSAIRIYRERFTPSEALKEPYVMACVNVVAADTDDEARLLFSSTQHLFGGVITGRRQQLQPPLGPFEGTTSLEVELAVQQMLTYSFVGARDTVTQGIKSFLQHTRIDEIMVTAHIYDQEARRKSYSLFAEVMQQINN